MSIAGWGLGAAVPSPVEDLSGRTAITDWSTLRPLQPCGFEVDARKIAGGKQPAFLRVTRCQ